jgi:hypothetical protein
MGAFFESGREQRRSRRSWGGRHFHETTMCRTFAFILLLESYGIPQPSFAISPPDLTSVQALADVRLAERALVELHPGLYRYRTPAEIQAQFSRSEESVRGGASGAKMYVEISRLAAVVQCGHTWTNPLNQSDAVKNSLFDGQDKLPLRLRVVEHRLLVTASTTPLVSPGDELTAIQGQAAAPLIAELLPLLRADGANDGKRLSQIDSNENGGAMDRLFPILHPPVAGRYALVVRHGIDSPMRVSVEATTLRRREAALAASGHALPDEAWQLSIQADLAVLTVPTFAFWRGGFDWRGFLDRGFEEMRARHVGRLVIDLRRNEGGDAAVGHALLSHLLSHPYTPPVGAAEVRFERVPYALARFLDTWDFDFFDHTGQVQRISDRSYRLLGQSEGDSPVIPAEPVFRGRVVALIGPQMSSAGFLIARDMRASHAALLVGQQTGGSLRGMNGGQLAWLTLPYSGVAIDIPLVAWVPFGPQPDQGILPDEDVPQNFDRIAQGIDVDMEAATRVLAQESRW